ncbi:diphosphomevalonate decarboxylase [Candidatus Gottesmanbacteria bacterium]|nr:diphosphomevalonate decarboxylase [Candidatus Gottesmanbacteria bacterium]
MIDHLDKIRSIAGSSMRAKVVTINTFPASSGIASSASGFAALTVAAAAALGLRESEKELSMLARLGSGSACRSIPDGFVVWEETFAYSIFPHDRWDLRDIIVIVASDTKEISSAAGMEQVDTSPKLASRLDAVPGRIKRAIDAIANKDIQALGNVTEEDCLDMHSVMQSQTPPLDYWSEKTKEIMDAVRQWRRGGLAAYFTIDAGPNVHVICEGNSEQRILDKIKEFSGVERLIINHPAPGAHLINGHLF